MYYYSKKNGLKIVHSADCFLVSRFAKGEVGTFETLKEAHTAGYRLCCRCAPIVKYIKGKRKQIRKYCMENGLICFLQENCISIKAPNSKWKIIAAGEKEDLLLYHKNKIKKDTSEFLPGYHQQNVRYDAVLPYLGYIVRHEEYRLRNPLILYQKNASPPPVKGTKRWRKEQKKNKRTEKEKQTADVLRTIDALERVM